MDVFPTVDSETNQTSPPKSTNSKKAPSIQRTHFPQQGDAQCQGYWSCISEFSGWGTCTTLKEKNM